MFENGLTWVKADFHLHTHKDNHKAFAVLNGYFVVSKTIWKIKTEKLFLDENYL